MSYTHKKEGYVTEDKFEDLRDTINNIQGWYTYLASFRDDSPGRPMLELRVYVGEAILYIPLGAAFRYEPATRKNRAMIEFQWDDYTLSITSSEDDLVTLFKSSYFEFYYGRGE